MYAIMKALVDVGFTEDSSRSWANDLGEVAMPGYGLYDRALGISYLRKDCMKRLSNRKCLQKLIRKRGIEWQTSNH